MDDFKFNWDMGHAAVQALGGMVGPITFSIGNGESKQPMSVAPWYSDTGAEYDALPGVLKRMRGEWPCVPFGLPRAPNGLPKGWSRVSAPDVGDELHGHASNNLWKLDSRKSDGITMSINYPESHVVKRLTRTFHGIAGQPALEIELCIEVRKDTLLPVSLHPVFRLPNQPGGMKIKPAPFAEGYVYPVSAVAGVSQLKPGAKFRDFGAVPAIEGTTDLRRLPLPYDTEEIVQICGIQGPVVIENEVEGYRATLDFDRDVFPSVQFWISNRGRCQYPWNGQYVGLGVEPVCAAFDLGPEIGCNPDNPIAKDGFPTALRLFRDEPLRTTYSIALEKI